MTTREIRHCGMAVMTMIACFLLLASCGKDEGGADDGKLPVIVFEVSSARYSALVGEDLQISPRFENVDNTSSYLWTMDDNVLSTTPELHFRSDVAGTYFVQIEVTNGVGTTSDELRITVEEPAEREDDVVIAENDSVFAWRFPWTSINVAQGRTVKVKAYMIENDLGGSYMWTLDGTLVSEPCTRHDVDEIAYVFDASAVSQGEHTLTLLMQNDSCTVSQSFLLTVCPPEGTYRRRVAASSQSSVNKVYEYVPAPGHLVNGYSIVGDFIHDGATMEEACAKALEHLQKQWYVSLGAQGGYIVAGFDHSVENSQGYDLVIRGNPFSYQSEPGIVWVSQDVNGDGLPNDVWYELAGSEYGTETHTAEYAITYYKPTKPQAATGWRDCFGATGIVPHMTYWNSHAYYWQDWVEGTEKTYFGTRLSDTHTYENGYTLEPPFAWGYADNYGSDYFNNADFDADIPMGYYKISNAKTWDGQDANLQYIDFVKIQTAQTGYSPNLGEISTEVYCIHDCHVKKGGE